MKHEIEIPGLPEGWRAVDAMVGPMSCNYIGDDGYTYITAKIKIEKIKPREVTLVETECENAKIAFFDDAGMWTYWRIKEE